MSPSNWIRQSHRWVAATFVATVIVTTISVAQKGPLWISYVPLLPLALLAITGIYLFVLPHALKWRGASRAGENA